MGFANTIKEKLHSSVDFVQSRFFMRGVQQEAPAPMHAKKEQPQHAAAPAQTGHVSAQKDTYPAMPKGNPRADANARQQGTVTRFDGYQNAAQAEEKPAQETAAAAAPLSLMAMTVNNINDCYRAINLVRAGNAIAVTLEGIRDAAEMRRMVDTLSGAAYSLTNSITKLSRHGVYILAPAALEVKMDPSIGRMNNVIPAEPVQEQPQQPQHSRYMPQQGTSYGMDGNPYAPVDYQQPFAQPQQVVAQRSVPQQSAFQTFYASPVQRGVPDVRFATQQPSNGYVPNDYEAAGM